MSLCHVTRGTFLRRHHSAMSQWAPEMQPGKRFWDPLTNAIDALNIPIICTTVALEK